MENNFIEQISLTKVLPIIRSKNPEDVINKAKALKDGGINIVEINVETPQIFNAIEKLSTEMTICAGGIITSMQAQTAIECGAKIIASPIFQHNLLKISKDKRMLFIAGTSTANEAYSAWKSRIHLVKIYPISAMGGVEYIENLLRPMPFLKIIPQGDVKLDEVKDYIQAGAIAVGIGRNLTVADSYLEITKKAEKLLESLK